MEFDKIFSLIEKRKNKVTANGIPINIKGWEDSFNTLIKGDYVFVTAGAGIAKTKFTTFYFVLEVFRYMIEYGDINVKITYFCTEETEERFTYMLLSSLIYMKTGKRYSVRDLSGRSNIEVNLEYVSLAKDLYNKLMSILEVVYDYKTPKHISQKIDTNAAKFGKAWLEENFWITIIDNLGFVENDNGDVDDKKALDQLCLKDLMRARKDYGMIPIVLQHQSSEKETPVYNNKGDLIVNRLIPSETTFAVSTTTKKPATYIIGIFSPAKFDIPEYPLKNGYDIDIWKDGIRFAKLLKGRDGVGMTPEIALAFRGDVGIFEHLPPAKSFNLTRREDKKEIYSNYGIILDNESIQKSDMIANIDDLLASEDF